MFAVFVQRDSGFEILADIPGVEKSDIKCATQRFGLMAPHSIAAHSEYVFSLCVLLHGTVCLTLVCSS